MKRGLVWSFVVMSVVVTASAFLIHGCVPFGARASGERLEQMKHSPEYADGKFINPQPLHNFVWLTIKSLLEHDANVSPETAPSYILVDPKRFAVPPPSGLRVTWFGHSSTLLEIDGHRILTDPMWAERAGPVTWAGPRRWFPPLIAIADLPPLDAVVISHDHFDHLDYGTIVALNAQHVRFIVGLGVGAHLATWGVPADHIIELDWWQHYDLGDLRINCVPARHASGRYLLDNDATLWAGYAFVTSQHRVYFSGDTGLFPAMQDIGERFGPFDLTMIEVGQYNRAWPDWHIGPEQAVRAHQLVRGRVMLPIHWGLLQLASHGWTEPMERALAAADTRHVTIIAPRPGESADPMAPAPVKQWWPDIPWHTGVADPIVSGQVPDALR